MNDSSSTDRRKFLQHSLLGTAGVGMAIASTAEVSAAPVPEATATDVTTIPLRALIPKGSRNIMVAGRSLGSDRLANSALRVQAPCMAMGQAAAVTATLAAKTGTTPLDVPLAEIHELLAKHGAIIPLKS